MPVTNVPMVAHVLKLTEPRNVNVLKASQASIVEKKVICMKILDNIYLSVKFVLEINILNNKIIFELN